ncbi:MAG: hypothetical protein J6Y69_08780, partial [Treponema sp.]|nr:hypothetical protein [Treponema sp.]
MRKRPVEKVETSGRSKFIAALMLATYILATSPASIFAAGIANHHRYRKAAIEVVEKTEALITVKDGGKIVLGDASIEIPEGALKEDTVISISRLARVEDTGETLYNAIPSSGGYRFLPAGTKFEKDVTITLPYSAELNSKPQSLEELYTYFYDTERKCWTKLERLEVDEENLKVRSLSNHFTDMINATLTLPESAGPVDVNLNSIKNLEAAKPDGHLIKFNAPNAGPMGDASFSFELGIPSGRRGMQPQISISYSSGGGNGIMGRGFDVNYGSTVTIDTRNGLPRYERQYDASFPNDKSNLDTYMLDGTALEIENYEEKSSGIYDITYRPLKESSYSRIKRYGAGSANDWWEVTDKSGTKRIYAQDKSSCVGKGKRTFTWNLTKVEDVHGNNIIYEYEKSEDGYVYPKEIYYTGFSGNKGNYSVRFQYDYSRVDVRIDARSKEIISCRGLLTGITTHYKGSGQYKGISCRYDSDEAIRSYIFSYSEGLAREKMLSSLKVSNNAGDLYEYTFDYIEPKVTDGKVEIFDKVKEWKNGTSIKTGRSDSGGASFNTSSGAGVGEISGSSDLRITGGIQGSFSISNSDTESTLADIDGDGRPDYIFMDGNRLCYRLNTSTGFSDEVGIVSVEEFILDDEESTNFTIGWNVYSGVGLKTSYVSDAGVTYSDVFQTTTSNSTSILADVDSDRKTDIILSDKDYYLKNTSQGETINFVRTRYSESSTSIGNNVMKLTEKEIQQYKDIYAVQTPFRQWKAEYDGIIEISEKMTYAGDTDGNKSVQSHVYKGNSESAITPLETNVSPKKQVSTAKTQIAISKGENLYFITETDDPLGSDINYNIKINYNGIKAYNNRIPAPVFFPQNSMSQNQEEESFDTLLEQKRFLPGAFTEKQFNELLNLISNRIYSLFTGSYFQKYGCSNVKDLYKKFASLFIHDITSGLYLIRNNNDPDLFELIYTELEAKNILEDSWKNYDLFGVTAYYDENGLSYRQESCAIDVGRIRSDKNCGTQIDGGNTIILGMLDGNVLSASRNDKKVFLDGKVTNDFSAEFEEDKENEILTVYLLNKENRERVKYEFTEFHDKAFNLTKEEMQAVVDDYSFNGESLDDEYWNWNEKKEADAIEVLNEYGMSDDEQSRFLDLVYEKTVEKIPEEEDETVAYTKKEDVPPQDRSEASEILHDVKFRKVLDNDFQYYSLSDEGEYILKECYAVEDENRCSLINVSKLIAICSEHGYGKYGFVQISIEYDRDGMYILDKEKKIPTLRIAEDSPNIKKVRLSPGKTGWDSFTAWNNILHAEENAIYTDDMNTVRTERLEKLLAGSPNWFFGIWIDGSTAFNGKNIEQILAPVNLQNYADRYAGKNLKEMSESEA